MALLGGGTIGGGAAGAVTGAFIGGLSGAGAALVTDLTILYKKSVDGGTPNQARTKVIKGQGPKDIKHIDRPDGTPNNPQWHAHGENDGAIYQGGKIRHRDPGFTKKTLDWLRDHDWKV